MGTTIKYLDKTGLEHLTDKIEDTYVKKTGDSMTGSLYIDTGSNQSSFNQGLRIGANSSNGWSVVHLSDGPSSSDNGVGWTLARRGSVGATTGAVGDFIIEHGASSGTGLTLYSNGNNPRWNNKVLVTGSSVGSGTRPVYISANGSVVSCSDTLNPFYAVVLENGAAGFWCKLATVTCNPGQTISSTYNPAESFMCFDVLAGTNGSGILIAGKLIFNNSTAYYQFNYNLKGDSNFLDGKLGIVYDTTDTNNAKIHIYGKFINTWSYIALRRNHTISSRYNESTTISYYGYVGAGRQLAGVAQPDSLVVATRINDVTNFLPLDGGTMNGQIVGHNVACTWINARYNASFKTLTNGDDYVSTLDVKTKNGDWSIGQFNTNYSDKLLFTYVTDADVSNNNNVLNGQVRMTPSGGMEASTYRIGDGCNLVYNSTNECVEFVW